MVITNSRDSLGNLFLVNTADSFQLVNIGTPNVDVIRIWLPSLIHSKIAAVFTKILNGRLNDNQQHLVIGGF